VTDSPASPSLTVRSGRILFRYRNTLFPLVLLALFLGFRPRYPFGDEGLDGWVDVLGFLVALTGQALRVSVIGYVYILRGGRNHQVYAEDLVTGGVFAHARNPLYLGNILILIGLFLIHGNPWVLALGSTFFLAAYGAIVAAEEEYLSARFDDRYATYVRQVPRWLPRLRGISESVAGMRFNWRRVVAKEYGSTFIWMAGAVLLQVQETLAYHSYRQRTTHLELDWALLAVLVLAWGTARVLKKTGRLRRNA
jgi:protein-S-isoprenylcysteine O-methyltransferase Ste14